MTEALTYLERLREIALDQHGFVSAAQAVSDGIPKTELPRLAARGRVERMAHGLYRIPQVPATPMTILRSPCCGQATPKLTSRTKQLSRHGNSPM